MSAVGDLTELVQRAAAAERAALPTLTLGYVPSRYALDRLTGPLSVPDGWRGRSRWMVTAGLAVERVGIDGTAAGTICTCWWIQRGPRGIEGGIGAPPAEAVADG